MLRSLKELEHYTVAATDGDVGRVVNFLVDEEHWAVRYLDVETGSFFVDRHVLVSPISFRQTDWATRSFHVQLTMEKLKNAPGTDTGQAVTRQHETALSRHFDHPQYWASSGVWGGGESPGALARQGGNAPPVVNATVDVQSHLRSVNDLRGYHVQGSDGSIGHVQDFIVDDQTWEVRYIVIETSAWWFGKRVLIAPQWATSIDASERTVRIGKNREAVRNSPGWEPSAGIDRAYESRLHDYYGRPAYWSARGAKPSA